ncbi:MULTISPECIES: TIR domain-containing protein [Nostoc]|uniref:TIR domain-containing protein n=1 Tax=Nostoc paludosum FACHB-159 TaxID=2692908 RepID=A0ABR8K1R8_9NOSO|nr:MULTISPECIES: TIR domain-containing protein [Nostoc]MBD2678230.1 TIR domain-containing protein [Nostoc sp. FACHB-857]MBD2733348.1 TIR domain-containing protein [Nostoc paludosum FACHB-159]
MTEAFISYSRKDKDFVKRLHEALKQQKRDIWVDWEGIPFTADWRKEIYEGIEKANNFIFIISPNSVVSEVCGEEIAYALKHNKRLVPIVWQYVEGVHPELAKINYIFFQESNDFNTALQSLLQALDTDLAHVKEHTRLLMLALEWDRKKRNNSYLLQGSQLEQAEQWFTTGAGKKPLITPLQQEYIGESRKAQRTRHRTRLILFTIGLVISTGSAIVAAIGWKEADRQRIAAQKSELQAVISASDARFTVNRDTIDALIEALKAGKKLKELDTAKITIPNQERAEVMKVLGQAIYWVRERDRLNESDAIISVSFSPDGEILATAGANSTVKLWNKHGLLLKTLEGHQDPVMSLSFSPDSQILASASLDGTVKLWSKQGKELKTPDRLNTGVRTVSFSPDGKTLAFGSDDNNVSLWNRKDGKFQILKGHNYQVNSVSFSPDGQILLSGSGDRKVKLWNKQGKELKTLEEHTDAVTSVSFSPNGRIFASASLDKTVRLWNRDGSFIQKLNTQNRQGSFIYGISFSSDGRTLATANDDSTVTLWDITNPQKPQELTTFKGHSSTVNSVSFSPNSPTLTLASASKDKTLKLWQIDYPWLTLLKHDDAVNRVSFSPDGEAIATVTNNGIVKLWNPHQKTSKTLQEIFYPTLDVSFSPDSQIFATASQDGKVRLWNRQGKVFKTLNHMNYSDRVRCVSFSPDGKIIATAGDDNMVKLWNRQGQLLKSLKHNDAVLSVSFSPNSKMIASASFDKTVKFWNLEGKELNSQNYGDVIHSLNFSPDSKIIAIAVGNSVKLRQLDGGEIGLNGHTAAISQVAFSPDGQMIATASDDKTVKLWHKDGTVITTLIGHNGEVNTISFSPDSKTLISGSKDGTAILWNVENLNLDGLMGRGCDWLHDYFHNNTINGSDTYNKQLCDGVKTQTGS